MTEEDLAFETLRTVRREIASELEEQLVNQCYVIQKKHQFEADRSVSSQLMDRLIDDYVDRLVAKQNGGVVE